MLRKTLNNLTNQRDFQKQPPELFLKISQNSQENTCDQSFFFNKVAGLRPEHLLQNISGRLLLDFGKIRLAKADW